MADAGRPGIEGLVACLGEQQLLRGTGVISVGDGGHLYLVFGHPLHAVAGEAVGLDAVDMVGEYARRQPDSPVAWSSGVTAGRAHSLVPSDGVVERLRRFESHETSARAEAEMASGRIQDLGLRRLLNQAPAATTPAAAPALSWEVEIAAICAALEHGLHRHSRQLVDVVGRAEPEPRSILLAIERARGLTIRAVSPTRVAALLDAAEAEVRQRAALRS
jgi:hypothetical protein